MIQGNSDVIKRSKESPAGDPSNLVNWDALNALPDIYDGQVVQVRFKAPVNDKDSGDFAPVGGGMYMPSTDLLNKIADARGISGLDMDAVQPIYNDIDWNRMTLNYSDPPKLVKMLVGYTVIKQGRVLTEDGTERVSSPCAVSYNAWERVNELWSKEEMQTDGYTKCAVQYGKNGFTTEWNGQSKWHECKYDTRFKRQASFDAELKFAERKADSKARNVVVRELCGMQTGYTIPELSKGYFIFYKIVRSAFAVKSEHAARLQALARGNGDVSASTALFGGTVKRAELDTHDNGVGDTPAPAPTTDSTASLADQAMSEPAPAPAERVIDRDLLIRAMTQYSEAKLVTEADADAVANLLKWLGTTPNGADLTQGKMRPYYDKAVARLKAVEEHIPEAMRVR